MNEDRATRYHRAQRGVFWTHAVILTVSAIILVPAGGAIVLRDFVVRATGLSALAPMTSALAAVVLVTIGSIVVLPVTLYRARLERQYRDVRRSLAGILLNHVKETAVNAALVAVAAFVVYFSLSRWSTWWWVLVPALGIGVRALLGRTANRSSAALFRCRPIDRSDLRARLDALAARAGVGGLEVYEWIPDADPRRANAMLTTTGKACRVLISNTLLAEFTPDEIEVIVAHELGHHVHRDLRHAALLRALTSLATGGVAALALSRLWQPLGLLGPSDAAGLPLLLLAAAAVNVPLQPLLNSVSRLKEYRADRFALALTRRPDVFMSVLRRLAERNLVEMRPSTTTVWFFHSHPTVEQRIQAARAFLS